MPGGSSLLVEPDGEGGTSVEVLERGWELRWSSDVQTSFCTRTSIEEADVGVSVWSSRCC